MTSQLQRVKMSPWDFPVSAMVKIRAASEGAWARSLYLFSLSQLIPTPVVTQAKFLYFPFTRNQSKNSFVSTYKIYAESIHFSPQL